MWDRRCCSLCLVSCVCERTCIGDSVCRVKILTARHLGCLRFSSSELHAVSCCVAVDRLNRGRWSALIKNDRGMGFLWEGQLSPLHSFSPVYSSLLGSVKTDRPVEKVPNPSWCSLIFPIRNQNWTCVGCCNFFSLQLRNFCFGFFFFLWSSIPLVRKFFCFGNLLCPSCYPRAYCMEPMPWGGGPWLM